MLSSYQSTDVDPPPPSSGDAQVQFAGATANLGGIEWDATRVGC